MTGLSRKERINISKGLNQRFDCFPPVCNFPKRAATLSERSRKKENQNQKSGEPKSPTGFDGRKFRRFSVSAGFGRHPLLTMAEEIFGHPKLGRNVHRICHFRWPQKFGFRARNPKPEEKRVYYGRRNLRQFGYPKHDNVFGTIVKPFSSHRVSGFGGPETRKKHRNAADFF